MNARLALGVAALFVLGTLGTEAAVRLSGADRRARRASRIKLGVYAIHLGVLLSLSTIGRVAVVALALAVAVLGAIEVGQLLPLRVRRRNASALFLIVLGGVGHPALPPGDSWSGRYLHLVVVVAAADAFAQVLGRLLGRTRLCPRLSPGKTLEGLVGGLVSAVILSVAFRDLVPGLSGPPAAILGAATALAATVGDLAFSRLKRGLGVKDFSRLIPGHGGVLDRFDSLVLAAPVHVWVCAGLVGWGP